MPPAGAEHVTAAVVAADAEDDIINSVLADSGITLLGRANGYSDGKLSGTDLQKNIANGDRNLCCWLLNAADEYMNGTALTCRLNPRLVCWTPTRNVSRIRSSNSI